MKISSYNITDVGYHYIGLRVLGGLPATARREDQIRAISRSVLKYANDKALRLMLPEPRGTFETVGEKVCQELVHFQFARLVKGAYELTEDGQKVLKLLDERRHIELRRIMVTVHLQTYDNLRAVVQKHLELGNIWRPIVEAAQFSKPGYLRQLLEPTFFDDATSIIEAVTAKDINKSPKKLEDALVEQVLQKTMPGIAINVSLFRALCDRLISLRLLNITKVDIQGCEFAKSYSPCFLTSPPYKWYVRLNIPLLSGNAFSIYLSEPDFTDEETQAKFIEALDQAFMTVTSQGGYYDLPEVRDFVCERLKIPESAFDEGLNRQLDQKPSLFTTGLRYDGISARRKPLTRDGESTQIYNLIRRI